VTFGGFATAIDFEGTEVDLAQTSASLTLSRQLGPKWGLQLMGGVILDGTIGDAGDVAPGGSLSLGASYLWIYEGELRPFLLFSTSLGVSTTTATGDDGMDHRLTSGDLRLGVSVGKTLWDQLSIYATGRLFGGPVFWTLAGEGVAGGDTHHYTVGAGAVWRPGKRFELFAEGAPVGEQSFAAGVSSSF
jgi:hypothetical protein